MARRPEQAEDGSALCRQIVRPALGIAVGRVLQLRRRTEAASGFAEELAFNWRILGYGPPLTLPCESGQQENHRGNCDQD
jgi:hypothetical protein